MTITLYGQTYTIVLTMQGQPIVIVQRGPAMWRVAKAVDAAKVLAGLHLRIVQ